MSTSARHATRKRAGRDIAMQVVVRVGNLALGVVVTALVVRHLGQSGYGQWSTALVVLSLVAYFMNFGMESVAVREAARQPQREHEWIGAVIFLRLVLIVPVTLASVGAMVLLHRSHEMLVASLILAVAMPFGGVSSLGLLFQLRVDNRVPMLVLSIRSILWTAAVVAIVVQGGGMVWLAIAMAATNAAGSAVQAVAAWRLEARWPRPSRAQLRPLIHAGMSVGIAGVLVTAYARIDQVIVYGLGSSRQAGLYGAVYNVLDQSHFVPLSILTTLAPVLAASWPGDRAKLLRTARLIAELLAVTSFGALAFAIVAAGPFVHLVFGPGFAHAAPALPVLGGAFVLICMGYLTFNLLLVLELEKRLLSIAVAALVFNVVGNVILVPWVGFIGAAWMTVATEAMVLLLAVRLIMQKLELSHRELSQLHPGRMLRTALAASVLGAVLDVMRIVHVPFGALVAAACAAYPALLFALRALSLDDVRLVLRRGEQA